MATTTNYSLPYPLQTDPVNVAGDISALAGKIDGILKETIEDTAAAQWTSGTFSNGLSTPTYNDTTGVISMSLSQDLRSSASPTFVSITSTQATGTAPFTVTSTTAVTNLNADLLDGQHGIYYAPINSPVFTGIPTASTASVDTNTTQIATTAYVIGQGYAKLTSPTFVTNITTPSIIASSSSALYRSTNSGLLRMWGGTSGSGGGIDLYGGTNANYANQVMINASVHSFRDTGGSTYFTITSASATSYVPFVTSAATTGNTSMRIPHGTAPSAPTDGDIWTTTAGVYVRINGSTVGPLGTGGGASWGSITGTLSSQTDLNTALSNRALLSGATFTGNVTVVSPTAAGSNGVRQITMSTSAPTGGADGDVWLVYV